jgi:hypothetical protein
LIGDLNAKVERENISKPPIGKENLYEISNDNGVREVKLAMSKNIIAKGTLFSHLNIHKYIWTSPDAKTQIRLITLW